MNILRKLQLLLLVFAMVPFISACNAGNNQSEPVTNVPSNSGGTLTLAQVAPLQIVGTASTQKLFLPVTNNGSSTIKIEGYTLSTGNENTSSFASSNSISKSTTLIPCSSIAPGNSCIIPVNVPNSFPYESGSLALTVFAVDNNSEKYQASTIINYNGVNNAQPINLESAINFVTNQNGNDFLAIPMVMSSNISNPNILINHGSDDTQLLCDSEAGYQYCTIIVNLKPFYTTSSEVELKVADSNNLDNSYTTTISLVSVQAGNLTVGGLPAIISPAESSTKVQLTLLNNGNQSLTLTSESAPTPIIIESNTCNTSSLSPGAKCTFKVSVTSSLNGSGTVLVKYTANSQNASLTFPVQYYSSDQTVSVAVSGVANFTGVATGSQATGIYTFQNNGARTLTYLGIPNVTNQYSAFSESTGYSAANKCVIGGVLAANTSCTIQIVYAPTSESAGNIKIAPIFSYQNSNSTAVFFSNTSVTVQYSSLSRVILVGDGGLISKLTTSPSINYTNIQTPMITINAVAMSSSKIVTVGSFGTILTSTNGISWSLATTSGTANGLWGITYGGGKFVAVGDNGTIVTSSDGITWNLASSGTTNGLLSITYGGGKFVAVGASTIVTSSDGITWSVTTVSGVLRGVAYGGGTFVTAGNGGTMFTSSNGTSWSTATSGTTNSLNSITYAGGKFVAVGISGTILTSSSGTSWSTATSGTTNQLNAITYGGSTFVTVGDSGTILTSSNGTSWSTATSGTTNVLRAIGYYGGSTFVAAGASGTILTSSNGTSWSNVASSGTANGLWGITYGGGTFVTAGGGGTILASSDDGTSWSTATSGTTNVLRAIAYGGGTFVAVGDSGTILTSSNGTSWSTATSGTTNQLYGITYAGGKFVAVGASGTILTSSNGTSWSAATSGTTYVLRAIGYGGGTFVAVGSTGTILTSSNGTSWSAATSGTTNQLFGITYAGGKFVAVGVTGTILTSSNGTSWSSATSGTTSALNAIGYSIGTFIAVGDNGTILTSSNGTSWTSLSIVNGISIYGLVAF